MTFKNVEILQFYGNRDKEFIKMNSHIEYKVGQLLQDENGDYIVTKTGDNLYSCQSSQGSVLHGPVAIYA